MPASTRSGARLLRPLLIASVVVLCAGMLRLTGRVTTLSLRMESLQAELQSRGGGSVSSPAQAVPPRTEGGGARQAQPSAGAHARGRGGGSGSERQGGRRRGQAQTHRDQMPDDETFATLRAASAERLATYLDEAELDEPSVLALQGELQRTYDAQERTRAQASAGQINDRERRAFLQAERLRVYRNVSGVLGSEGAEVFMARVMGLSEDAAARLAQLAQRESP